MNIWKGSPWIAFSCAGVKGDQIRFLLLAKKLTTNLPTSIDPSELTARIQKAAPKYILVHQCPSRKESHSPPRDETRYAQSRGDLVFPTFTLCPIPQPSATPPWQCYRNRLVILHNGHRSSAEPEGLSRSITEGWSTALGEKMAETAGQKPNLCRTQCLVHKN